MRRTSFLACGERRGEAIDGDVRPKKIRLGPPLFVVADACTMVRNSAVTGAPISQTEAVLALREHLRTNPQDGDRFTVVPQYAEAA